jgi:hypothetical protein
MSKCEICHKLLPLLIAVIALAMGARAQGPKALLHIQRLKAELETDSTSLSIGRNAYDSGLKGDKLLDVQQYPNSATCVVVYDDGKYFFEKREEHTVGKQKAKSAEGTLSSDDFQHLKAILDEEELKKITSPKAPELPPDATVLKEAERLDVQVNRGPGLQQFSFMKERVSRGASITGASSGGLSGMDTYLDNGAPYKKTVAPLVKWLDELGKKNKLKDSKPQYCQPIIGS